MYGSLRKHQARALKVSEQYVDGKRHAKVIVAGVTPGGGKTMMASIFANVLADGGLVEQVIVVVPNDSLREQMRHKFHDFNRGLNRYLKQKESERGAMLPGLGSLFGEVVTYQALATDRGAKRLVKLVGSKRTLLVFDECHHLCENKAWERNASKLVEAAELVLVMSGTLWRWDEERIPFVNYDAESKALVDIKYSRAEALEERAVLPVEFRFFDGKAIYEHRNVPHSVQLSSASKREQARAIKTALQSWPYVEKFLTESFAELERHRRDNVGAQAIAVFHSREATKRAHKWAQVAFAGVPMARSLCGERLAERAIKSFKEAQSRALFTVRKAYEGLDVPAATHLFYLGDSRSWPFLDQVIARVTRFDEKSELAWEQQRGFVFMPDDMLSRNYVANMHAEQDAYFKEREQTAGQRAATHARSTFVPDTATVTEINYGLDGRPLTQEENIGIRAVREKYPQLRAPLSNMLEIAYAMNLVPIAPGNAAE